MFKNNNVLLILAIILLISASGCSAKKNPVRDGRNSMPSNNAIGKNMEIVSNAFSMNGKIPVKYTCDGDNINPDLNFAGIPDNAKSLALIMDDPDAPMGTYVHWVVWNIAPASTVLDENSLPENSTTGTNSSGKRGYTGPCPPGGTHRYYFKLYALDKVLDISAESDKEKLLDAMEGHIISESQLIGLYSRS